MISTKLTISKRIKAVELLPPEIQIMIMSQLSLLDILMVSKAIPSWAHVALSKDVWSECPLNLMSSGKVFNRSSHNEATLEINEALLQKYQKNLRLVKRVDASFGGLTDEHILPIINYTPNLSNLDLSNCPEISGEALLKIIKHTGPTLRELKLCGNPNVDHSIVKAIIGNCFNLEKLAVDKCPLLEKTSLVELFQIKPLKVISLERIITFSYEDWIEIADALCEMQGISAINLSGNCLIDIHILAKLANLGKKCTINVQDCERLVVSDIKTIDSRINIKHNCMLYDYSTEGIKQYLDMLLTV